MAIVRFAHRQNADLVAIFLTEQCKRTSGHGIIRGHQPGCDRLVPADLRIHVRLNQRNFLWTNCLIMREVEAQAVWRNQAALLRDMLTKTIAQRCMQQMRGAMVRAQ